MSDDDLIRRGDAFAVVKGLSLLEGDILALPAVTVGAMIAKVPTRYQTVNGDRLLHEGDLLAALEPVAAPDPAAIREALLSLPAVYAHQINTGVREVYDPLQRFYTMESVLAAITEATK